MGGLTHYNHYNLTLQVTTAQTTAVLQPPAEIEAWGAKPEVLPRVCNQANSNPPFNPNCIAQCGDAKLHDFGYIAALFKTLIQSFQIT